MSSAELNPNMPPVVHAPDVAPDLQSEQSVAYATLSAEHAAELRSVLQTRLVGIDVMNATADESLDAMRAASLTTDLLTEAISADPAALPLVGRYRGPIHLMANAAAHMHESHTGHPLREAYYSGIDPDQQEALRVLDVVKKKAEDRNWDGSHSGHTADPTTAVGRRDIALHAVHGLQLIAEGNSKGRALVSSSTAKKVVAYLESRR